MFGAGDRQGPGLGAGGDDDVVALDDRAVDIDRVGADEPGLAAEHGAAFLGDPLHGIGDEIDHRLLPVDQPGPVEPGLADFDAMDFGLLDLVERMGGGDQHLLRRTAPVRTGAAEIPALDEGDALAGLMGDGGNAETGIAAADDHDIKTIGHDYTS